MKTYLDVLLAQRHPPSHANGYFPLRRPPGFMAEGPKARKVRPVKRGRPPVSER